MACPSTQQGGFAGDLLPEAELQGRKSNGAELLLSQRRKALQRLAGHRMPSGREELWRYTSPELFPWGELRSSLPAEVSLSYLGAGSAGTQERLPDGLTISHRPEADIEQIEQLLCGPRAQDIERDPVADLLFAAASSLTLIRVRKNAVIDRPLSLQVEPPRLAKAVTPIVIVWVEEGAKLSIVEDLCYSEFSGFLAPRFEFVLAANSFCEFVSTQRLSSQSTYLARHRFHLMRDARLCTAHIAVGAAAGRVDLDCKLYEPGAQADLSHLYVASGEQHLDFHPTQWHLAPHCRSELRSRGALRESARAVYFGYIRVAEIAQQTDAYQSNRNLLLSESARADAIPNLEIRANDVKCSHGASIGQVGTEELFYLMSRGLPRAAAERLLVEGFFEEVLARLSDRATSASIQEVLKGHLHG